MERNDAQPGAQPDALRQALQSPTKPTTRMFDHVKFGASDYAASKAFFLKALEPLGVEAGSEGEPF